MKKRAVAYIRVSEMGPKSRVDLKESPDTQLEYIRKYCELKGYELVEIYQDLDYSGGSDKRPSFQRLFDDIEGNKKKIDIVIVYNLNRFARNLKDLLVYLDIMLKKGVDFASCTEEFLRTDDYMGSFMINIVGAVAEFQRKQTAQTVRDNMLNIAKTKGRFLGGIAPFGYRINSVTKEYEIKEEEAEVVKLIFDLYISGKGLDTITQYLIENKILGEKKYSKSSIRTILVNPIYTGDLYYNRRRNIDVDRKKWNSSDEWIVNENTHDAIISKEAFMEVQKIMKEKSNDNTFRNTHRGSKHLLSGLLICSNCGNHYFANTKTNASGNKYEYYICSGKQRHTRAFCSARGIRVDKVDPIIIDSMKKVIDQELLLELFNNQFAELTKDGKEKVRKKLILEKQQNKLEGEINDLFEKMIKEEDEGFEKMYRDKITERKKQVEEIQIEIESFDDEDLFNLEGLDAFKKMLIKGDKFELTMDFVKMLEKELQRNIVARFIDQTLVEELEDGNSKLIIKYKINAEDIEIVQKINRAKVENDFDERREIFNKILMFNAQCGSGVYTGPPVPLKP